jgi:glycosyltransferase involved in cell wall biosynthesis
MTTVSEPWAGQLKDIHRKRVEVITNGYDPEDYEKEEPTTAKFTITHTGHLQSWDEKQIPQLFMAAADLQREGRLSPDTFEIRFFGGDISGSSSSFIPQLAKKYALENLVSVHDYVPYQHSIKMQKESTVLFLSRSTDPVGGVGVFSAKIYEYLGAKRPIMAMALKGDVIDKFLKETGAGIVANEKEEIKSVLSTWVDEFERKGDISAYFNPDNEVIKQSTYRMQAEKLAALLDEITVSKP